MAGRPTKAGLDYFELDCHMEAKVRLIQAEYGLKGFAIVVKLYQKIYGEFGYYCEWNEDSSLLFMSENGVSSREEKNLIKEIVSACIRRDIFSEEIYKKYGVLTSVGVQKRYLNAVSRRESVELKKEYLLVSVGKNSNNVVINSINVDRNSINVDRNSQSKGKESRVKKINNARALDHIEYFEEFWSAYPLNKNRHLTEQVYIDVITDTEYSEKQLVESAKNYAEYCQITGTDKIYHANNFLSKAHFEDYLPGKYKRPEPQKAKNGFNNIERQDYDINELEKNLLSN